MQDFCIGLIMDGNRRWAKERNLPTMLGHKAGYEKIKDVLFWADEIGVSHIIIYAFSTENWNREKDEVSYLMNIFREASTSYFKEASKERFVRFIGDLERLPVDVKDACLSIQNNSFRGKNKCALVVALSYGGRDEILRAVSKSDKNLKISEQAFSNCLDTEDLPDPDIILRTGGEKRLSGFLPWQSVYSELFFLDTFWPDFSKSDFIGIVEEYKARSRRFGK